MSWILIQLCVATVGWQVGASSALFLNSQNEAAKKTLLHLTTPASSGPEEGLASRHGQQTLVLNSRGRSASAETPRARLRVRLPRKSEAQTGSEAGRFSQFPAVAPLESMKAPTERDPLTPVIRQGRQNQGNFALARQNQAPGFPSQPSFLSNAPNRNNFRNRPRQFGGFNSGFNGGFNGGFNQNQQFRNTQQRPGQFESNRQSQSNNNFAPQGFRQISPFANPQTSSFPASGQNTGRRPSVPAVRTTTQAVPTTTTTITTTTPTTTTPPPTTTSTTTTSTTTTSFPVSVSVVPETRQPRVLGSSPAQFRASTFRPNLFSNQRGREGRAGHADHSHDAGYGGYQAPEPVYHPPPQYGNKPTYKILKMTGLDTAPIPEFNYMFKTENKINVMGQGELRTICDEEVSVMRGSYDYYGPDGKVYKVDWYADETGFHPSAEHLPKSVVPNHPEVAAAVAAQLEYAASQHRARRAAGYAAPPPCPPKYKPAPQYKPPPPSYTPS